MKFAQSHPWGRMDAREIGKSDCGRRGSLYICICERSRQKYHRNTGVGVKVNDHSCTVRFS